MNSMRNSNHSFLMTLRQRKRFFMAYNYNVTGFPRTLRQHKNCGHKYKRIQKTFDFEEIIHHQNVSNPFTRTIFNLHRIITDNSHMLFCKHCMQYLHHECASFIHTHINTPIVFLLIVIHAFK